MAQTNIPKTASNVVTSLSDLESGMNARKWFIVWMSVAGVFLDGYDITIISVALLVVAPQFHVLPWQLGLIGSATLVGNFVGAIVFGNLADRIGRKFTFYWDILFFVVFALLSAFSQNIFELILTRALLGIGIGADYALASPIIAEILPTKNRGRILAVNWGVAWFLGEILAFAVGYALLPFGADSWRWMLGIGCVPAIIVMIARRSFVESPRWQRSQGQLAEAIATMNMLEGHEPALPTAAPPNLQASLSEIAIPPKRYYFRELLSPAYRRATLFAVINYFMFSFAFYMTSVFLPTLLKEAGFSKGPQTLALGNLEIQSFGFIGLAVCVFLIEPLGRRWINMIGFAGMAVGLCIYLLSPQPTAATLLIAFAVVQMMIFFGPGIMDNVYLGELWPTRIRATGAGVGASAGRFSAILGTFALPVVASIWGVKVMLLLPLVACIIAVFNTAILGIETAGRSLEEMWGE